MANPVYSVGNGTNLPGGRGRGRRGEQRMVGEGVMPGANSMFVY